ncbi:MAG TPA: hypothetical protein VJ865_05960, partial [Gemmatimonadaceae bacterium]|nr:hypothetical protein [Gemmatimonadaceae bacterium]
LEERGSQVLAKLGAHLIEVSQQPEWPGTKLLEDTAAVHRFRFNFSCAEVLKDAADRLYDWIQPVRPEDPCILRDDGTEFLTSITHERWAGLTLTTDEVEEFKLQAPLLAKSLRRNTYPLE